MTKKQYSYQEDWDSIYQIPGKKPWEKAGIPPFLLNFFDDNINRKKYAKSSILDVGCGRGELCEFLSKKGYKKVTGVDVSQVILDQCPKDSKVRYEWMDVVHGDFTNHEKYDFVICWFLLHHIQPKDFDRFIANLSNLCNTGGMLILSFLQPGKTRNSFFTDRHKVNLYSVEEVLDKFSSSFYVVKNGEEEGFLFDQPDEHLEKYRYHLLRMRKLRLSAKDGLSGRINEFEKNHSANARELMGLLNTFSRLTRDGGGLLEEDYAELFKSLFQNVSRYVCRKVNDVNSNEKVVILKMDTPNITVYSASCMRKGRVYCMMNPDEKSKVKVKSRAYELFYKYSDFLGQSSLDASQHYTIHKHFAEHPDLEFIGFWWDNSLKTMTWPPKGFDIKAYPNYNRFLQSLFMDIAPVPSPLSDNISGYSHNYFEFITSVGVGNTKLARSFSAFNLGIPGFESWGTLMVEGIKLGFEEVRKLFYEESGGDFEETALLREIKNILFILKKIDYDYYGALAKRRINLQSAISAIAQVMARNLSHNYGSHVLNHLVNPQEDTFKFKPEPYLCKTLTDDKSKDTFQQIVFFNNHIKCRVDYISDISYGAPLVLTSRNVYGDVFCELDRVSLLMNHISGLENQFKYEIVFRELDGVEQGKVNDLNKVNDLAIAIPNDVIGTHAFYNILENVIRNTAKHSKGKREETSVVFDVVFSDVQIEKGSRKELEAEAEQYYSVDVFDDVPMDWKDVEALVEVQNRRMKEPVFENEHPRSHSLGLVEMLASAAYLRRFDTSSIAEDNSGRLNLLEARMRSSVEEDKFNFGYRFYVLRPQEVLVVGNDLKDLEDLHNPKAGVWTVDAETFKRKIQSGMVYNHEFVVCLDFDEEIKGVIDKNRMALSPRVLALTKNEVMGMDPTNLTRACWECWDQKNDMDQKWKIKFFSPGIDRQFNSETAVYKHHLETPKDQKDLKGAAYAEAMSSVALDKLPQISEIGGDSKAAGYCIKLLGARKDASNPFRNAYIKNRESVNTRILVIDERIQDAAEHYSYGSGKCVLPFSTYYKQMGVVVPSEKILNLSEKDFAKVADKIKRYIKGQVRRNSFDFVLIHYGILERIFKPESETEWEHNMADYLNGLTTSKYAPRIVLTSGRGVPRSMPGSVGFVSLSSVTMALIDYKSKYLISRLMYAARRSTK